MSADEFIARGTLNMPVQYITFQMHLIQQNYWEHLNLFKYEFQIHVINVFVTQEILKHIYIIFQYYYILTFQYFVVFTPVTMGMVTL